jgi:hypothetical protein
MNHSYLFFEIQADDIKRAIGFYRNVFGWKFNEHPNLPVDYFDIKRAELEAVYLNDQPRPRLQNTGRMPLSVQWRWNLSMTLRTRFFRAVVKWHWRNSRFGAGAGRDILSIPKAILLAFLK